MTFSRCSLNDILKNVLARARGTPEYWNWHPRVPRHLWVLEMAP